MSPSDLQTRGLQLESPNKSNTPSPELFNRDTAPRSDVFPVRDFKLRMWNGSFMIAKA
jgi:hypothetical protein